jgi:EAL domain-containing protein (putative c-di-GMP-specific phosphodiesterase class I)
LLKDLKVDFAQGYFLGRPAPLKSALVRATARS